MDPTNAAQPFDWPNWLPDWLLYFEKFDTYIILFLVAAVVTAAATPVYILIANRLGWVDRPAGRKRHQRATATMGGLVIFTTVFAGAYAALRLDNLVGQMLREKAGPIYGLIACTTCMILLGMIDDRHVIRPKIKLLVQTVVAIGAIILGFRIEAVTLPWYDSVLLPQAVGVLLSLFWIVGITNAINLTDGLDGLAAGICLLAAAVNAVVAIYLANYYMTVMMVLLAGSLLGFLRWNFHPARVFLGDTGSLGLGMFLALASLHSAQKSHTVVLILIPLFALGYPIFDTLLAIARRMVRGQPLFASDRDHIHHRLLDRGRSPSRAAIQIYIVSILLCLLCIAAMTANYLVLGLGVAGALAVALFSTRVLGYLEWGGWAARWSGREETKVLHAAASLARLKMEQAGNPRELLRALAVIAPEISCRAMALIHNGQETEWHETEWHETEWADPDPSCATGVPPVSSSCGTGVPPVSSSCGTGVPPVSSSCGTGVPPVSSATTEADEHNLDEMILADNTLIRFAFDSTGPLDEERSQLLEDLCRRLNERLQAGDRDVPKKPIT